MDEQKRVILALYKHIYVWKIEVEVVLLISNKISTYTAVIAAEGEWLIQYRILHWVKILIRIFLGSIL